MKSFAILFDTENNNYVAHTYNWWFRIFGVTLFTYVTVKYSIKELKTALQKKIDGEFMLIEVAEFKRTPKATKSS